ncbi:MAG TPA: proton-conducting transporter membrane subunit [Acidimicrobiales bacterium]|nr:proton-conducting transporter membrane subunit [Acidimicrobiales bacterium]
MTARALLVVVVSVPALAGLASWRVPRPAAAGLTIGASAACLAAALVLAGQGPAVALGSLLRVDALSKVFLLATALVYATGALFAAGWVPLGTGPGPAAYGRRFFAGFNLFAWSMLGALCLDGFALLWVAVEVTTVVSALLVGIDDTEAATEAAWKYLLLASLGLGIALLATVVLYHAGARVLGPAYQLSFERVLAAAPRFSPPAAQLAFALAVLGYGTKMGLVPVHTWLPDAHSEAPTPVSALLSGSLLSVSFYAILRFDEVARRAAGPTFCADVLAAFGFASLGLAACYMASQSDLKRLLAYSSVEHMGILAVGASFASPVALAGVLLHVLAHAAAKSGAFFGAGSLLRRFGTKQLAGITGGVYALPVSGPLTLAAVAGLAALPPSGLFRSEFLIVSGGLAGPGRAAALALVPLAVLASLGLGWFGLGALLGTPAAGTQRGEPSAWAAGAMAAALAALAVLGLHPPGPLSELLARAAHQLGEAR